MTTTSKTLVLDELKRHIELAEVQIDIAREKCADKQISFATIGSIASTAAALASYSNDLQMLFNYVGGDFCDNTEEAIIKTRDQAASFITYTSYDYVVAANRMLYKTCTEILNGIFRSEELS